MFSYLKKKLEEKLLEEKLVKKRKLSSTDGQEEILQNILNVNASFSLN